MFVSVYITAKDRKEAAKIAGLLVKSRLAACANIFPVESAYWWKGRVQNEAEYAIIAKTQKNKMKKVVASVRQAHSYSVPCIVSWQITGGNKDFLHWIRKETSETQKLK